MKQGISIPYAKAGPLTDFLGHLGAAARTVLREHWVVVVFLAGMLFLAGFGG